MGTKRGSRHSIDRDRPSARPARATPRQEQSGLQQRMEELEKENREFATRCVQIQEQNQASPTSMWRVTVSTPPSTRRES